MFSSNLIVIKQTLYLSLNNLNRTNKYNHIVRITNLESNLETIFIKLRSFGLVPSEV